MNYFFNLRKIRRDRDITQVELAKELGVSPILITNYETGKTNPSLERLVQISIILDCDLNDLIKYKQPRKDYQTELTNIRKENTIENN